MASLNKKLAAYTGAAVAAGGAVGSTSHAALVTVPFAGGTGTGINDGTSAGGAPTGYFEQDSTTTPTSGDTGRYVYLKTNGNVNGAGKDNSRFIITAPGTSGVLVNLAPGTIVGATPSTGVYSGSNIGDTTTQFHFDLGYVDTTTNTNFAPPSGPADQFTLGTTGYVGLQFNPGGGASTDFGYVALTYTPDGTGGITSVGALTFDDSGAPVTIPGAAVPEPASLGILALGAVGLLRRKHA